MHAEQCDCFDDNVVAVVIYTLIMNLNIHIFSWETANDMHNNDTV